MISVQVVLSMLNVRVRLLSFVMCVDVMVM